MAHAPVRPSRPSGCRSRPWPSGGHSVSPTSSPRCLALGKACLPGVCGQRVSGSCGAEPPVSVCRLPRPLVSCPPGQSRYWTAGPACPGPLHAAPVRVRAATGGTFAFTLLPAELCGPWSGGWGGGTPSVTSGRGGDRQCPGSSGGSGPCSVQAGAGAARGAEAEPKSRLRGTCPPEVEGAGGVSGLRAATPGSWEGRDSKVGEVLRLSLRSASPARLGVLPHTSAHTPLHIHSTLPHWHTFTLTHVHAHPCSHLP